MLVSPSSLRTGLGSDFGDGWGLFEDSGEECWPIREDTKVCDMMWLWEKTPLNHRKSKTLRRSQVHTTARASNLQHSTHKRVHEVTQALTGCSLW